MYAVENLVADRWFYIEAVASLTGQLIAICSMVLSDKHTHSHDWDYMDGEIRGHCLEISLMIIVQVRVKATVDSV